MSPIPTLRYAASHEADDVIEACLEAFADEAVLSWAIPDPRERQRLFRTFFAASLRGAIDAGALLVAVSASGEMLGAALWEERDVPQGAPAATEGPSDGSADATDAAPKTPDDAVTRRLVQVARLTAAAHPTVGHVALNSMAARPAHRGRGIGSALLRHGLADLDERGLPAYLEASTPRNRALYERFGFRPCATPITLPDGGPTLQPMWRAAPPPS